MSSSVWQCLQFVGCVQSRHAPPKHPRMNVHELGNKRRGSDGVGKPRRHKSHFETRDTPAATDDFKFGPFYIWTVLHLDHIHFDHFARYFTDCPQILFIFRIRKGWIDVRVEEHLSCVHLNMLLSRGEAGSVGEKPSRAATNRRLGE